MPYTVGQKPWIEYTSGSAVQPLQCEITAITQPPPDAKYTIKYREPGNQADAVRHDVPEAALHPDELAALKGTGTVFGSILKSFKTGDSLKDAFKKEQAERDEEGRKK
jgi:hypothetical protein